MSNQNQQVDNRRYIGKVKNSTHTNKTTGEQFSKSTILLDNPNPTNQDQSPNPYYKGALMWFDAATGQYYQVKQIELAGVSQQDATRGFTNSLKIDLGNNYQVDLVKN